MRVLAALGAALAAAIVLFADAHAADAYTVDPIDRVMTVAKRANVRAGPGTDHAVRVTLDAGATLRVTGAVQGRDWLRVDLLEDGGAAFVYAPLLKDTGAAALPGTFGPDWSVTQYRPCNVWNNGAGDKYEAFTWSGPCVDGMVSGQGRLAWRSSFGNSVYEGGMQAGKQHGSGILKRSDGSRYEGEWRNGNRHGRGTYVWAMGHRYEGDWRHDRPDGYGIATFADGDVFRGQWRAGCYGERDGLWAALITTVEACGFD